MRIINDWRERAACNRAQPDDSYFPEGRPPKKLFRSCAQCPVREECLETALSAPWTPYGIWGGLTTKDLLPLWSARHPRQGESEILQLLGRAG